MEDLLGVSMIVPLLPKMMFNMFQSRSRAGMLGKLLDIGLDAMAFAIDDVGSKNQEELWDTSNDTPH